MHIYLQTKAIKKAAVKAAALAVCTAAAIGTATLNTVESQKELPFSAINSKYLSVYDSSVYKGAYKQSETKPKTDDEMNNSDAKNANAALPTEKIDEVQPPQSDNVVIKKASLMDVGRKINVYDSTRGSVVKMELEEYVAGCVAAEMPSSFSAQALMAQSVAARTFAVRRIMLGADEKSSEASVCTDYRHCQSYVSPEEYLSRSEYAAEQLEKIRQAVKATEGVVALYDGEPINAVYHAASGYGTKSSREVWGGEVPYLQSVKAAEDSEVCSKQYTFTYGELSGKLTAYCGDSVECFAGGKPLITAQTDENGCVESLEASGETFSDKEVKNALCLRSDDFSAEFGAAEAVFTTYGYGHRVGMSQYGAEALAQKGWGYTEILKYYYSGIEFGYIY